MVCLVYVSVHVYLTVCASACMLVHQQLAEDRRPHVFFVCPANIPFTERRMETDALWCSSAFFLFQASSHTHTLTRTQTHSDTQRKLPHIVAKRVSINLLHFSSNWHIDWWGRVWGAAKWLLAGLQRERDRNPELLSKTNASVHFLP